jgi:hypothetical protein
MLTNKPEIKVESSTNKQENVSSSHDISIWLDTYNDIFSDFDPRPYSNRTLSDDFLIQVKKVSHEKKGLVKELKLSLPNNVRDTEQESVIVKKLHKHFKKNHQHYSQTFKSLRLKGLLFALIGVIAMLTASYVSIQRSDSFLMHAILVIFEPAGWFLVWWGLETIFYTSKAEKKELEFYTKLSKSKISFYSI